ncbi:hypothetical protein GCM10010466_08640 [Planomonospora alba]|uniref:SAF domain-containing protein n=1 Tax=Planomonospora alba TaxID=161354 RepID=A0ABP6MN36_9ACTN
MTPKILSTPPGRTAGGAPPVTVPRLPGQPRQRRRGMVVFGLLIIAGGGALTYHGMGKLSDRVPVVVMARDVAVGQEITRSDVTTAMVGADETVATVPGHELQRVVGMRAAVDLMSGALVQRKAVTDRLTPAQSQQLVPVAVKPSRLPARGFAPGDMVLVVPAPGTQTAASTRSTTRTEIEAVIDQVKGPDTDGLVVVDLLVGGDDGSRLATLAADGEVAFVLNPRRS